MWREGERKRDKARIAPLGARQLARRAGLRRILQKLADRLRARPGSGPTLQELGTIEAGSKVEITASGNE